MPNVSKGVIISAPIKVPKEGEHDPNNYKKLPGYSQQMSGCGFKRNLDSPSPSPTMEALSSGVSLNQKKKIPHLSEGRNGNSHV